MPKALFPTLFLVYVLLSACVKNQDINAPTIRVGPKINLYQGSLGHDNHAVVKTEGQNLMICGSREGKLLLFSINDKGVERFYEEVIFEGITFAQGILQLDNNDFLVTGHRKAENEPGYLQVHKFNQYGKRLWTTRFKSHFIKWGKAIVTLKDSSMYVVSAPEKSAYNLFLNKFDNNGNLKWSKEFKLNYDRIK
ncbi:MAG: hypothetical protein GW818_08755, partial [Flavobacteriales bacterium]|nr:hypothetical protein [Flavobacteriales bacterium]